MKELEKATVNTNIKAREHNTKRHGKSQMMYLYQGAGVFSDSCSKQIQKKKKVECNWHKLTLKFFFDKPRNDKENENDTFRYFFVRFYVFYL